MSITLNKYTDRKHAVGTNLHTVWYIFVYSCLCTNYYSGKVSHVCFFRVTFRMKSEAEFDETCLMQIFGTLDNMLGKGSTQHINPYPTAFPYGNGMVLHFYQQQESSTTKTVHKVINRGLETYV